MPIGWIVVLVVCGAVIVFGTWFQFARFARIRREVESGERPRATAEQRRNRAVLAAVLFVALVASVIWIFAFHQAV